MALLDHVAVRVTDLDRSIAFYRDMFGFEMVDRRMLGGGEKIEAAAMKVGESLIFLLHNPAFAALPQSVEGRPDHFCLTFEPDEFEAIMSRLKAGGVLHTLECLVMHLTRATRPQ